MSHSGENFCIQIQIKYQIDYIRFKVFSFGPRTFLQNGNCAVHKLQPNKVGVHEKKKDEVGGYYLYCTVLTKNPFTTSSWIHGFFSYIVPLVHTVLNCTVRYHRVLSVCHFEWCIGQRLSAPKNAFGGCEAGQLLVFSRATFHQKTNCFG